MKNLEVPIDANGGDLRMVLTYLRTRINDTTFHPDVMLLNCGLHDIKRRPSSYETAYRHVNLSGIKTAFHLWPGKTFST